jgi:hypothetical protein
VLFVGCMGRFFGFFVKARAVSALEWERNIEVSTGESLMVR